MQLVFLSPFINFILQQSNTAFLAKIMHLYFVQQVKFFIAHLNFHSTELTTDRYQAKTILKGFFCYKFKYMLNL